MKSLTFALMFSAAMLAGNEIKANLPSEEIFRAMQDEMNRSMRELRLENLQQPYYMEYKISIKRNYKINGMLGQITRTEDRPRATLDVVIRVGDYKFDQKNFFDLALGFFGSTDSEERFEGREIPLELDYNTLRREFWLATDPAYKEAVEIYSKKEASFKNKIRRDTLWDFSNAQPIVSIDTSAIPDFDVEKGIEIVKAASEVFNDYKSINLSSAALYFDTEIIYFLNSEGTKYQKNDALTGIEIVAFTQAQDGMPLSNFYTAFAINPNDLPSKDSIVKATKEIAIALENNINAEVLEDSYSGPILLINQAACEAFAQIFLINLVAQREAISEGISFGEGRYKAFQNKIGGRVLPEFFSIEDLPSLQEFNKTKLFGHYLIDDDGIMPQDLELVRNGYLKTLLADRTPIKRINQSNGRNRSGTTIYSNIKIDVDQKYQTTEQELKNQIIRICKQRDLPFGIIVKKIMNMNVLSTNLYGLSGGLVEYPGGGNRLVPLETYKIYPDGREELVRGGILAGMSVATFKDIIRTSNDFFVYNMLQDPTTRFGRASTVGVSIIGRSVLFEDGELQTSDKNFKKPPFLENPIGLAK